MEKKKGEKNRAEQLKLFDNETGRTNVFLARPQTGENKLVGLKKDHRYYREMSQRLLEFQETEEPEFEDGVKKPYIREGNLREVFHLIKREVNDHLGTLKDLGFLKPKETAPRGWYICPEGFEVDLMLPLKTKKLRGYASKLYRLKDTEEIPDGVGGTCRRLKTDKIISWLMRQGEAKPLDVLAQLEDKRYLLLAGAREHADSYYICRTQKEGRSW